MLSVSFVHKLNPSEDSAVRGLLALMSSANASRMDLQDLIVLGYDLYVVFPRNANSSSDDSD